jgi:feruloyl-CoA synthase
MDGGELTDKGYINQRAGLERRAGLVDALYRDPPPDGVVVVD